LSKSSRLACAALAVCCGALTAGPATAASGGSTAAAVPSTSSVGGSAFDPSVKLVHTVALGAGTAKHLGDRLPVRKGMSGHDVRILQDFLRRVGLKVTVDGEFGSATAKAVRSFEKRTGRPVDGRLDHDDYTKLIEVLNNGGFDDLLPAPAKIAQAPAAGDVATLNPDGTATAPADAPDQVKAIVTAGNEIATKPYRYGGGHQSFDDSGYDCSGSISYALHGASLLTVPRDSTGFETFGQAGAGQWVTIYTRADHAYLVVAGLRFDTSGRSAGGSRWQTAARSSSGYVVRHPAGL
jgi:peptidoglycan hydrolase-like protein with peptidoglycan-binding domain